MKHPMSAMLREMADISVQRMLPLTAQAYTEAADELDRQRRDIAILCECIEATRNPGINRVYAECDVAEVLERNRRCPASA